MHRILAATVIALTLLAAPVSAKVSADLVIASAGLTGQQQSNGVLLGMQVTPTSQVATELIGFSPLLHLRTTNTTAESFAFGSILPTDGGVDRDIQNADVRGFKPGNSLDILLVPIAGTDPPTIEVQSTSQSSNPSTVSELRETGHVNGNRELLSTSVGATTVGTHTAQRIRISGTFSVSIWDLNLTVEDEAFPTGSIRTNVQRDPLTGTELAAHTLEQVAQLTFNDGWLEITGEFPLQAFYDESTTKGSGEVQLNGVQNLLGSATNSNLLVTGDYEVRQARTEGELFARFTQLDGQATLDGKIVQIPIGASDSRPGTVVAEPSGGFNPWFAIGPGIIGLMLVAVLLHGPMRSIRFRSIQRDFADRDYIEVINRIDPFTRLPRFRRQANFLKAVSLLSLQQFKEASLFLETLRPLDGPDPATRAFLRACAAAGQAQDADAIQHLTDCFRLDPSYREEARTVPALRGLLPYFDVEAGAHAA